MQTAGAGHQIKVCGADVKRLDKHSGSKRADRCFQAGFSLLQPCGRMRWWEGTRTIGLALV